MQLGAYFQAAWDVKPEITTLSKRFDYVESSTLRIQVLLVKNKWTELW